MAIIYEATLVPSKHELLRSWLGRDPGDAGEGVDELARYRFDDPAGEVGVEAFLLRRGGRVLHVPLTYRAEPLAGTDAELIGTMEHSVLGTRWVYDGRQDPVALSCYERALRGEQEQAVLEVWEGDKLVDRQESEVRLRAEGSGSTPTGKHLTRVTIRRDVSVDAVGDVRLVAEWAEGRAVVAVLGS